MSRLITVSFSSSPTQTPLTDKSLSFQSCTKSHINPKMFSKFQKASDKLRLFVHTRANVSSFGSTMSTTTSKKSSPVIQDLYDLCKNTFLPSVSHLSPSSSSVQTICSLLDTVGPADVGLKEDNPDVDNGHGFGPISLNRIARWSQPITFLDIFESDRFTMCIFCFPSSSVIPLHDHPGMTVFSKILYGSLHVKAYDWVDPPFPETKGQLSFQGRLAKLVKDEVVTAPCDTSVLYPKSGGNLHCFTAITPCAVLDILAPPYREDMGRGCTYFTDYPYASYAPRNGARIKDGKEEDYAWLVEVETPKNLYMRPGRYVGPTIQV